MKFTGNDRQKEIYEILNSNILFELLTTLDLSYVLDTFGHGTKEVS